MGSSTYLFLLVVALLVLLPGRAQAFGAGNIASISKVEGTNWRHGDIEDMLATVACLRGHKWNSMMIKRVYFGNWLRDYSQALDVGTLKGVQAETIRVLVWILAFMSFGYATGEFEVTADRLGVYRAEEHIDNPRDYADNVDARKYDSRLRGPVDPRELEVDINTGMKNYIANEQGNWATSTGYVKFSFARSIHYGRVYTHGASGQRGNEKDLCEALRCLGQGLHCLEDFGAHTNYTELTLRELGFHNVFPHTGANTQINLHGKHVFPLVTGTFGGVDFLHSVLGEANDHISQSEVDQMNTALVDALANNAPGKKSGPGEGPGSCSALTDVLGKVPGTSGLVQEAMALQASSDAQAAANAQRGYPDDGYSGSRANPQQPMSFDAPPGSQGGPPGPNMPGTNLDPATIIPKIYPILEFRDKVVKSISAIISKIPGLEKLIETITERVTLFVLGLLAPFIKPIIDAANKQLKIGSSAVVESSGRHQFEVWQDPHCTDPTHSLLSKDHFSNVLNEPAGKVAAAILQYCAPRVVYAWDHPDVPVDQVLNDICQVFHHPAIRNQNSEIHRNMFEVVQKWAHGRPDRGHSLDTILSSDSVREGMNHSASNDHTHGAGAHGMPGIGGFGGGGHAGGGHGGQHGGHQQSHGGSGSFDIPGVGNLANMLPGGLGNKLSSNFNLLNRPRDMDDFSSGREGPPGSFDQGQEQSLGQPHWGSFQPYESQYAGGQQGASYQPYGGGEYHGGPGADPSYTIPTAYQQGYDAPYQQPPQGRYGGPTDYPYPGYQGPPPPGQQGGYDDQQQSGNQVYGRY